MSNEDSGKIVGSKNLKLGTGDSPMKLETNRVADDNSDVFRQTSDILRCSFSPPLVFLWPPSAKMTNNHTSRTTAPGTGSLQSPEPSAIK